jgi:hypothetical protein
LEPNLQNNWVEVTPIQSNLPGSGNILKKKLEAQWAEPVSFTFHSALRKLNTEPFIHVDASYHSVHMAKQFQRRRSF